MLLTDYARAAARTRTGSVKVELQSLSVESPRGDSATLYVGSKESEVRVRIYESGKVHDYLPDDFIRGEIQVRPKKDRKSLAASLEPEGFWGMSKWARDLRARMGELVPAAPVRTARVSDLDGALDAMCHQYGRRLLELIERLEGDLEAFSLDLLTRVYGGSDS